MIFFQIGLEARFSNAAFGQIKIRQMAVELIHNFYVLCVIFVAR
jgi:hypothetical protein